MAKKIYTYDEHKEDIINAIDLIADPIRQTISPKGANVVFDKGFEGVQVTNDGVTIAKSINVEDELQNAVINIIKQSSLQTNNKAGDGTSTTILLSSVLSKEGLSLVDKGYSRREIQDNFNRFGNLLKKAIEEQKLTVKSDKDLGYIANISANNDSEIAKDTVKIVKKMGEHGQLILEGSHVSETEIIEDSGFAINSPMFSPEFSNVSGGVFADYKGVAVLITDKNIYHEKEAEKILTVCQENDIKEIVIVAKNFTGDAFNMLAYNHTQGNFKVLLIKDPSGEAEKDFLDDLATYLGGDKFKNTSGSMQQLTYKDFVFAKRIISNQEKTTIVRKEEVNIELTQRISNLEKEITKLKDAKSPRAEVIKSRLALLTTGIVTVKAGGRSAAEVREKLYRYEDSISATQSARKHGYLVGGGLAIKNAFDAISSDFTEPEYYNVYTQVCTANIRQIAENSGKNPNEVLKSINESKAKNFGYNSLTDSFGNLLKQGVVDPYEVTQDSIANAISIANIIISTRTYIIEQNDKQDK